ATSRLPTALLDAARRLQREDAEEDLRRVQLVSGLRAALVRALGDGFGPDSHALIAESAAAEAANDERVEADPIDPAAPPARTLPPEQAFAGLAAHTFVAGVRRSLTTPASRLAARAVEGERPARLDERPDLLAAVQVAAA